MNSVQDVILLDRVMKPQIELRISISFVVLLKLYCSYTKGVNSLAATHFTSVYSVTGNTLGKII